MSFQSSLLKYVTFYRIITIKQILFLNLLLLSPESFLVFSTLYTVFQEQDNIMSICFLHTDIDW